MTDTAKSLTLVGIHACDEQVCVAVVVVSVSVVVVVVVDVDVVVAAVAVDGDMLCAFVLMNSANAASSVRI